VFARLVVHDPSMLVTAGRFLCLNRVSQPLDITVKSDVESVSICLATLIDITVVIFS
jgi:hypothetical protein